MDTNLSQSAARGETAATQDDWKGTILAGLANYIDAGSIVAGSAALALWATAYQLTPSFIGILGAVSANAISAGIGALIGGRLCDRFGRKKIYQYDMLFYAFGMAWLVFATAPWMIVIGFILVGLAVGADIPASWSLIAEQAPKGRRGKHSGVAQLLWYLGPTVVLLAAFAMAPLGILGMRIIFAHLAILALVLTLLRSRMKESQVWLDARQKAEKDAVTDKTAKPEPSPWRELMKPKHLKSMAFLIGMYGLWNLWAGTSGFFFPYILTTVGNQSQAMSVGIQAANFGLGVASIYFIFMRLSDKVNQRLLFAISAVLQVLAMLLLVIFPLTLPVAIAHVVLGAVAVGFGAQSFFQLWSGELFPTMIRSTAQGVTFAVVRIGLGFWSFFVPILTATGFHTLALILTGFLVASGLIGFIWAPRNEGKSLDEIQAEREDSDTPRTTAEVIG